MRENVMPLSGDAFCIEASIHGVAVKPRRSFLMDAVLSDDLIDQWIEKLMCELAAIAPEMKAELRKVQERPLFGGPDA